MLRDDPACPGENPIYIASISKGSVVEGKLKVRITMMIISMIMAITIIMVISTLRTMITLTQMNMKEP